MGTRLPLPAPLPTSWTDPVIPAPSTKDPQAPAYEAAALQACERLDGWGLRQLLEDSHRELGLDETVARVLMPALRGVGERWAAGEIGVGQEHLFSATLQRWLHSKASPVAPATGAPLALLACGPGEAHGLALDALETLLNHRGWAAENLGASTPVSGLRTAVRVLHPTAVVLVAHLPQNRDATARALAEVAGLLPADRLFYAGGAFAAEQDRLGLAGLHLGPDLVAAADRVAASATAPA